ncbi:MAG: PAS domain-containing sensor histidine kinase [Candidatus Obscuribacterales bacterium]|nr:PAS domain-containing sensor histidine kinase [Candidatus Obscuribacterales bacterium]
MVENDETSSRRKSRLHRLYLWSAIASISIVLIFQTLLSQTRSICADYVAAAATFSSTVRSKGTAELTGERFSNLRNSVNSLSDIATILLADSQSESTRKPLSEAKSLFQEIDADRKTSHALAGLSEKDLCDRLAACLDRLTCSVREYEQRSQAGEILLSTLLLLSLVPLFLHLYTLDHSTKVLSVSKAKMAESDHLSSSERSLQLLNMMPLGVALVDENLKVVFVSKSFKRITGLTENDCIGINLSTLLADPTTGKPFTDNSTIFEKSLNLSLEVRLACKNSDFKVAQLSLLWGEFGGRRYLLANFLDVTGEYRFRQLKEDVANMVSHDLSTPLASLKLMAELLGDTAYSTPTERGKQTLGILVRECDRLQRLVQDLLNLGKLRQGNVILDLSDVKLAELINDVLTISSKAAQAKGISLTSTVPADVVLQADRDRISQILVNLVSNAIRYCDRDSSVWIECKTIDNEIKIIVADNGPGIAEEEQALIFERYYQAQLQNRDNRQGHGLGLAICKLLVKAHGGEIGIESQPGHGSRFWFTLPQSEKASVA